MADEAKITFFDNETYHEALAYIDSQSNLPVSFANSTFKMSIRDNNGDISLTLNSENEGIIDTDLENGKFEIVVAKAALQNGQYNFDLVRVNGVEETVLLFGKIEVLEGITQ